MGCHSHNNLLGLWLASAIEIRVKFIVIVAPVRAIHPIKFIALLVHMIFSLFLEVCTLGALIHPSIIITPMT